MWLLVLIFNIIITFIIIVGEVKDNDLSLEEVEQFFSVSFDDVGEGDASVATPRDSTTCTRMCNSIITFINCFVFVEMVSTSTPMRSKLSKEQRLVKAREMQARYRRRVVTIDIPQSPEPRPKKIKIEFLY